ncbi:MAG TPA: hypothetical protein VFY36_09370 [Solirubrobacteraceae bacterium]|nr:hypothetical protein [Solirubrobacteraceae bacterium]
MKVEQKRETQGLVALEAHERVDGIAVAGELPLVAIAKARRPPGDDLGALAVEHDVLDRVRRRYRSNPSGLGELLEELGQLVCEQALLTSSGIDSSQSRTKLDRLVGKRALEIDKAPHGANYRIIMLKSRFISTTIDDCAISAPTPC